MFNQLLLITLALFAGCKNQGTAEPTGPQPVRWEAISPPRPDLECWRMYRKELFDKSGTLIVECWPVEVL